MVETPDSMATRPASRTTLLLKSFTPAVPRETNDTNPERWVAERLAHLHLEPARSSQDRFEWVGPQLIGGFAVKLQLVLHPVDFMEWPPKSGQFQDMRWAITITNPDRPELPSDRTKHRAIVEKFFGGLFLFGTSSYSSVVNPLAYKRRDGNRSP
jgi:hypothetical protein